MFKKLNSKDLLNILSSDSQSRLVVLTQSWPMLNVDDVKTLKFNNKTFFSLVSRVERDGYLKKLNLSFLSKIKINSASVAYKNGKSYLDFFSPHVENYNFLRLDLKSFFHSISYEIIKETFESYFLDEYFVDNGKEKGKEKIIDVFLNLVMLNVPSSYGDSFISGRRILPMGFSTSPLISNIVFRRFDIVIHEFCEKHNIKYSRYADDMLFSSNISDKTLFSNRFHEEIKYILNRGGFKLNNAKTIQSKGVLSVNGYVIDSYLERKGLRLSSSKLKNINKIIHALKKGWSYEIILKKYAKKDFDKTNYYNKGISKYRSEYEKSQILNLLVGYRSYLISFHEFDRKDRSIDNDFLVVSGKIIKSIEKAINKIYKDRKL
ncbi:reverse transcriptase family protein [Marinomonas shanghaiensis]|uniref:reverse transcriptase family protein n=1 Tax=Marinomonas shanghaiensis TaxID=2202418 RepID=UPI000DB9D0C5|nr:reverse transcriptase family protein [Marinomonas shanghaiensis]